MNVLQLLDDLGVPHIEEGHHHCTVHRTQIDCPFCSPAEDKYRMGIHLTRLYASCWTCGSSSLANVIAALAHVGYTEAKSLIAPLTRQALFTQDAAHNHRLILPHGLQELTKAHVRYLQQRGIDVKQAQSLWGLKGLTISPDMPWRIWVPVYHQDEVMSWTTRKINDQGAGPKYITARPDQERAPARHFLIGMHLVHNAIIVVEGPMDAMRIGPGAAATMGVNYSQEQFNTIVSVPLRYVCFDSDIAGQARAGKLCRNLSLFPGRTHNVVLDAKDPNEASDHEIKLLRRLIT
jgi:hypothetical protein